MGLRRRSADADADADRCTTECLVQDKYKYCEMPCFGPRASWIGPGRHTPLDVIAALVQTAMAPLLVQANGIHQPCQWR